MAIYVANYQSDLGRIYQKRTLFSNLIDSLSKTSFSTSYLFDSSYIPQVFKNKVLTKLEYKNSCFLNFQPRLFKLYLTETTYLSLPCPFMPTSTEYLLFQEQIISNPLIISWEIIGEVINDSLVQFLTKNV